MHLKASDMNKSVGVGVVGSISLRVMLLAALALLALIFFFVFYEKFPRQGWVDAGIYTGYGLNPHLYKLYPFSDNAYQGSRLGYLLPFIGCVHLLGEVSGRYVFVTLLYCLYVAATLLLAYIFDDKKKPTSLILIAPILLAPQVISDITYGGSGGVGMVFQLCAIAAVSMSKFDGAGKWMNYCAAVAGACWAVAISAHIFAIYPIFVFLLYIWGASGLRFNWRPALLGFLLIILLFQGIGSSLGAHRLYLSYSFPWMKHSLRGSGADFVAHSASLFDRVYLWLPYIGYSILAIMLVAWCAWKKKRVPVSPLAASLGLLCIPLSFVFFDYVIGGNILSVSTYQALVMPAMVFFAIYSWHFAVAQQLTGVVYKTLLALGFLAMLAVPLTQLTHPSLEPSFKVNHANSEQFYESQVRFLKSTEEYHLDARHVGFVFQAVGSGAGKSNVYVDSYAGNERRFDYIDSLAALFLWDKSIYARLNPLDSTVIRGDIDQVQQIIVLGRSRSEVLGLSGKYCRNEMRDLPVKPVCGGVTEFSWCWLPVREC